MERCKIAVNAHIKKFLPMDVKTGRFLKTLNGRSSETVGPIPAIFQIPVAPVEGYILLLFGTSIAVTVREKMLRKRF